jgi:cell shape-determining protein MreD
MKRLAVAAPVATICILIEGLFLSGFDVAVPSLLAVAILLIVRYPFRPAWLLAIWCGLLLDLMSTQVFGSYMVLAIVMLVVARFIAGRGFEMSRLINIGLVVAALIVTELIWTVLLLASIGAVGVEMLLLEYAVFRAVLTWVVGFFLVRLLEVTMDV